MTNCQFFTLDNGLKLILLERPNTKTVSTVVLFKVGPVLETNEKVGVSHFIEHLLLEGKNKKGRKFSSLIEAIGGYCGGFTRHHFTEYFFNTQSEHIDKVFDTAKNMLFNPHFSTEKVETEKGVVNEEISGLDDSYEDLCWIRLMKEIHKDDLHNFSIIGEKTSLEKLDLEKISSFYSNFYTTSNCIFVVAGDIKIEEIKEKFRRTFYDLPKKDATSSTLPVPSINEDKLIDIKKEAAVQIHCLIGFSAPSASDEERYPMQIIANVLGGKTDSRLHRRLIEKGLLYHVYSYYEPFIVGPYFFISFKCKSSKFEQVYQLILKELDELSARGITEEELFNSKRYLQGRRAISNESNQKIAETIALSSLFNIAFNIYDGEIEKTTLSQVNKTFKKYFLTKKVTVRVVH